MPTHVAMEKKRRKAEFKMLCCCIWEQNTVPHKRLIHPKLSQNLKVK